MITPSYGLTATERVLPKLALDWTTGVSQPGVDVVRAGVATFVGSNGLVQSATADTQRIDWSRGTPGLLIEESRQNQILQSGSVGASPWVVNPAEVTLTQNDGVAPDGTSTASRAIGVGATNRRISQTLATATTIGVDYTASVYVKLLTPGGQLILFHPAINTGVIVTSQLVLNQWVRVVVSRTATASAASWQLRLDLNTEILVWGAQFEQGSFATSYIPTTTTALTRNADVATMTGTNFSDWFDPNRGSFSFWWQNTGLNTGTAQLVYDGVGSVRSPQTTLGIRFYGQDGGVLGPFGTIAINTQYKFALAYQLNQVERVSFNAVNVVANSVAYTTAPTSLGLGCTKTGAFVLNGYLQKLYYWNVKLTDAELLANSK